MRVRLAETVADDGAHDAALATIDAELVGMTQSGQRWFLAEAHRAHGEILGRSTDPESAERAFACAIGVARDQSARQFEIRAAKSLARVWAGQGKSSAAVGLLSVLSDGDAVAH